MKVYCNSLGCHYNRKLDAPVDYMPYKGYKTLYEYKFYGECIVPSADLGCMCGWPCLKCSFNGKDGCLKDIIFIDKSFRQENSCRCFSDKFFSGHMDWSRFANQKKTFL